MCAKLQTQTSCKSILTIITLIIPLLTSSTNEPTSKCDGLMITNTNNIQFYPTNVCTVHYDDQKDTQLSTMFQCTQDGSDITINIWPNTDCAGTMIADHDLYDNIINNNYSVFCTGVPCNYGIVRYYPISNCNASIDEYNNKYWDKIIIINDSFTDTVYTKCNNGSSIEGESESIMDGSCNEEKFISKIICGNTQSEIISNSKGSVRLLVVIVTVSVVAFLGSLCFILCFIHKNYSSRLQKQISRMKSFTSRSENTSPMGQTDNFQGTIDYDDDDTSAQTANQV